MIDIQNMILLYGGNTYAMTAFYFLLLFHETEEIVGNISSIGYDTDLFLRLHRRGGIYPACLCVNKCCARGLCVMTAVCSIFKQK